MDRCGGVDEREGAECLREVAELLVCVGVECFCVEANVATSKSSTERDEPSSAAPPRRSQVIPPAAKKPSRTPSPSPCENGQAIAVEVRLEAWVWRIVINA